MGNRLLTIVHDNNKEVSPTIYLHWSPCKQEIEDIVQEQIKLFDENNRTNDVAYFTARLAGRFHNLNNSDTNEANQQVLSFGIWNTPTDIEQAIFNNDIEKLKNYQHGDLGLLLINVQTNTYRFIDYNTSLNSQNDDDSIIKLYTPNEIYLALKLGKEVMVKGYNEDFNNFTGITIEDYIDWDKKTILETLSEYLEKEPAQIW